MTTQYRAGCKTCFHGPTDHRGSRITATILNSNRRITRPWKDELDIGENHAIVAAELLESNNLVACSMKGGGYVFIAV